MTLDKIKPGSSAKVTRVGGEGAFKRRIMEMGVTRGTEIAVKKVAPLGDPMELSVRGYDLSIRKHEAAAIEVVAL